MTQRGRLRRNKVTSGDGRPLGDFRWWHVVTRSVFYLDLSNPSGDDEALAVDVHYFDEVDRAHLYRDGHQIARARLPASFPVTGGAIEVAATTYGLSRMHYVTEGGDERVLRPHPLSLEGLRARFGRRHPRLSVAVGWVAVAVLLTGLVVAIPQVVAWISELDVVASRLGTFSSPITLPRWANTALVVGGILAALERALTLRNHWLIDADTWWMDD